MSKIYEALKRAERERELSRRDQAAGQLPGADVVAQTNTTADEYRRLRASLAGISDLHTILVVAGRHQEGTTRTAIGLASTLAAEQGPRVLLFEANLRSPSFASLLPLGNGPGVSDVLSSHARPDEVVTRVDVMNLCVVHAGTRPVAVDCEAIGHLVSQLSPQFDFTILDVPPVNRYADAAVLAAKVDGVILVVEADSTPVADAENAKRSLDKVGARILGVVLNRRRSYIPPVIQTLL
jgi:capsular exopolysaccharide synthesis family protein